MEQNAISVVGHAVCLMMWSGKGEMGDASRVACMVVRITGMVSGIVRGVYGWDTGFHVGTEAENFVVVVMGKYVCRQHQYADSQKQICLYFFPHIETGCGAKI